MAIKADEKKDVMAYAPRIIAARIAPESGCEMLGSDAGNPACRFPWPIICPACKAEKLKKHYWYSGGGNTLHRECDRCGCHFGVQG